MSTTIEKQDTFRRFTSEEIKKKMLEDMKRDYREFREFWWPLMQEQRRLVAENDLEESAE